MKLLKSITLAFAGLALAATLSSCKMMGCKKHCKGNCNESVKEEGQTSTKAKEDKKSSKTKATSSKKEKKAE
jgi:hypothetical protein